MNKTHRKGIDLDIAFRSASTRLRSFACAGEAARGGDGAMPGIPLQGIGYSQQSGRPFSRMWVMKRFWSFAGWCFFAAKPIIEPVAVMVRRFLIEEARQGIVEEIRRTTDATILEMRARHDLLVERMKTLAGEAQTRQDAFMARLKAIEGYAYASARRVAVNCGNGEILVKTDSGFIICPASDHGLTACLLDTGDLERGVRRLIERLLRPGDVYVDVGANVGIHVLAAARAMEGKGRIIAFEPFEPTTRMLEKTIRINGLLNITEIRQAAVSNVEGRHDLHLGLTSGHHSLYLLEDGDKDPSLGPVTVPLVRLDRALPQSQRIDLLKIDAEGAELEVVEGGTSLIKGNPDMALIVEFGNSHLKRTGHTPEQWMGLFFDLGLDWRVIDGHSGVLEAWPMERLEGIDSVNLLFARKGSRVWGRVIDG